DKWLQTPAEDRIVYFRQYGLDYQLDRIKQILLDFGVTFDQWFSESSLYENKKVDAVLQILRDKGFVYDEGGATWFKSTHFGDDKDRVLVKNDGTYTYLAPDIAYHLDK